MKEYLSFNEGLKKIPHGGDYNPEQWPEEVWQTDMEMFKEAGIDCLTLNVFSWASLQPSENVYDFSKLDKIVKLCVENDMMIIMATSTAAHPAWMAKRHPDITRVMFGGTKRKFGDRHNSCPNSPTMKTYAPRLAGKLAERYKDCKNIIAWHISNEYGGRCYCENCENAFRDYLREKYGTIDRLNEAWNAAFWGHTFYEFDEIVVPDSRSEMYSEDNSTFPAISVDYWRFMSDSMLNNFVDEAEEIKKHMPSCPVTTNFMDRYKILDCQKWSEKLDFASWDSYPAMKDNPADVSMWHDMMRSLKGGKPWVLMEQTPSVTNWQSYCSIKRPGVLRLWSYRAIAHGADAILYFQMRRTRGACEKTHGAVIDHVGRTNTRVFREVSAFGAELKSLKDATLGAEYPAEVAILFDWDNWWDYELCAGPHSEKRYFLEIEHFYRALYKNNIPVDFVSVNDDLDKYKLVIAPTLFMVKSGYEKKINRFVENGGRFITSYFSGMVNETDLMYLGGHPGPLSEVLGIWVEETDALDEECRNSFVYRGNRYECSLIFDIISEVKGKAVSSYEKEFYRGTPCLTEHEYGAGKAYYVASSAEQKFYDAYVKDICDEAGIVSTAETEAGIECTLRVKDDKEFLFVLNHNDDVREIKLPVSGLDLLTGREVIKNVSIPLEGYGVMIVQFQ